MILILHCKGTKSSSKSPLIFVNNLFFIELMNIFFNFVLANMSILA
jgi:hypothetical protein